MKKQKSPVIKKTKKEGMDFGFALYNATNGEKVTRMEWNSKEDYGFIQNETLMIHTKGKDHIWVVSLGDIIAKDWIVFEK